jgi:hypothetical protein
MKGARRILVASGAVLMAYAVLGAMFDPDVKLIGVLVFLVAVLVLHDGVLVPLYIGVGAVVRRVVPAAVRTPFRVGLVLTLAVTLVALPAVLGLGRDAGNPSILPLHYGRGLLETLAVIWATIGAATAVRAWRRRARPARRQPARSDRGCAGDDVQGRAGHEARPR